MSRPAPGWYVSAGRITKPMPQPMAMISTNLMPPVNEGAGIGRPSSTVASSGAMKAAGQLTAWDTAMARAVPTASRRMRRVAGDAVLTVAAAVAISRRS